MATGDWRHWHDFIYCFCIFRLHTKITSILRTVFCVQCCSQMGKTNEMTSSLIRRNMILLFDCIFSMCVFHTLHIKHLPDAAFFSLIFYCFRNSYTKKRFAHAKSEFKNINYKFHTRNSVNEEKISKTNSNEPQRTNLHRCDS